MTTPVAVPPDQEVVVERARRFVDEELIPREQAAELAGGRLPDDEVAAQRQGAVLDGGDRGDRTSRLVPRPV